MSASKKKNNKKGVTVSLHEFQAQVDNQGQWGDMENDEEEFDVAPNREQQSTPSDEQRANRQYEPRENKRETIIPDSPPFVAYVGNLSFTVTAEDLRDFFSENCTVEDVRLMLHPDKKSRGFAYVYFKSKEDLETALSAHNYEFNGRALRVDVSTPREKQPNARDQHRDNRDNRDNRDYRERKPRTEIPTSRADNVDTWERGKNIVIPKPQTATPPTSQNTRKPYTNKPRNPHFDSEKRERNDEPQRERVPLKLQPKSEQPLNTNDDSESSKPSKPNPFGDAKPRDEKVFEERKRDTPQDKPSSDKPADQPKADSAPERKPYVPPQSRSNHHHHHHHHHHNNNNSNNNRNQKKKPQKEADSEGFVPTTKSANAPTSQSSSSSSSSSSSGPVTKNKFSALSDN